MGGLSFWHLVIVLIIVLVVFGPSKIAPLGKSLGEAIRGFQDAMKGKPDIDVTDSVRREQIAEDGKSQATAKENETTKKQS